MSAQDVRVHRTFPKSVQAGIPRLPSPKTGWGRYKFGDVFEVVPRPIKVDVSKEYDLVTVKRSRGGIVKRSRLFGSKISVKSQFTLEENDFLISKRQIVHGACAVVSKGFVGSIVSNEYSVLRCKPEFDLRFMAYLSHTIYFQQTCFHSSVGVHVEKMIFKLDDWFKFPINLPSLPEQKKIAAFLGVMDDKLSALKSKRDLLGDYKRGLMQALFSQQIRFTDNTGQAFPDWEEKRLGDVLRVKGKRNVDNRYKKSDVLSVSGVFGIVNQIEHLGRSYAGVHVDNYHVVDVGDIVYTKSPLKSNPYGIIKANKGKAGIVSTLYAVYEVIGDNSFEYIDRYFEIDANTNRYLRPLVHKGAKNDMKINNERVLIDKLFFPHPDEQQKIADALSALDAKIAAVSEQVAGLEAFKKGLLQQMFV